VRLLRSGRRSYVNASSARLTELAASGVTDDEPGSQVYRDNIRNAQRTCGTCAKCGTTLPPRAPVWREPVPFVPDNVYSRTTIAPVCERCKSEWRYFFPPKPCMTCERPVHNLDTDRLREWVVCCEACLSAARAQEARRWRHLDRDSRDCEHCGDSFEPTRTDARFCSSACRQSAYRERNRPLPDE
jgi:hypothetical protein